MLSVCRRYVNEQIVLVEAFGVNCVYTCAHSCKCRALLLIGLVRERRPPFQHPPPHRPPLVTDCNIDPQQLHFLPVSKFIRCSAFRQADRIHPLLPFLQKTI